MLDKGCDVSVVGRGCVMRVRVSDERMRLVESGDENFEVECFD